MTLVRFNPFRDLIQAQTRLNTLLGDAFASDSGARREAHDTGWDFGFLPPVDIRTGKDHALVIETELPGVAKEDVSVRIENRTLTIRGERKRTSEAHDGAYHRAERLFGNFIRTFSLPETVDVDHVGADYRDGVLTVTLPRKEDAKPRAVDVRVG
jgi:HSP20 family protein